MNLERSNAKLLAFRAELVERRSVVRVQPKKLRWPTERCDRCGGGFPAGMAALRICGDCVQPRPAA